VITTELILTGALTMSTEEFKIRNLRGAVCEYLDDGNVEDLLNDLRRILDEEECAFVKKAVFYMELRHKLFK
jgi:hypothetical protein